MRAARPDESTPAWAFRWLQTVPQPTMVLSGMTNLAQMQDNIKTFSEEKPLSGDELSIVYGAAEKLAKFVPCTGCRYCCAGCPKKLDIPNLINLYNDIIVFSNINPIVRYDALPEDKRADACIGLRPVYPRLPAEDRRARGNEEACFRDCVKADMGADMQAARGRRGSCEEEIKTPRSKALRGT